MVTPLSSRTFTAPFKILKIDTSFYSDSALDSPSSRDPPQCFSDSNAGVVKGRSRQARRPRTIILDLGEGDDKGNDMADSDEDLTVSSEKRFKPQVSNPTYSVESYLDDVLPDNTEKGDWVQNKNTNGPNIDNISKDGLQNDLPVEVKTGRRRWQVEGHNHRTSSFLHKTRNRLECQNTLNNLNAEQESGQPVRVMPESRVLRGRSGIPSVTVHCSPESPGDSPRRIQYRPVSSHLHRSRSEVPETSPAKVLQRPSTSDSSSSSKMPKAAAAARSTPSHLSNATSTNQTNSTSSNSWGSGLASRNKTIPRRQWSKPNPDLLLKLSDHTDSTADDNSESGAHVAKNSRSQMVVAENDSVVPTDLSQLSRHPSLAGLLSSGNAASRFSRKEEVMEWLKTGCNGASNFPCRKSSPYPTSDDAASWEDKSEDVWLSCRDAVDTIKDISSDELLAAERNAEQQSKKKLTLEIVSESKGPAKVRRSRPTTPVSIKPGSVGGSAHLKKTSTFANLEETFNKQCQSIENMRKTRSCKLAWPQEALEQTLDALQKSTGKEKNASIQSIGRLAAFYPEVAEAEQLAVVRSLAREIRDCRPQVVRLAVICLLWLFARLRFNMVQGLTETYDVLLEALMATKCRFLKQDLWAALDHLIDIVVPQQAIQILVYLFHKYEDSQARVAITRFILNAIEKLGSGVVLRAPVKLTDVVLQAATLFAKSADPLIRANGLSIIRLLEAHPVFTVVYKVHLSEETVRLVTPLLRIHKPSS